MNCESEQQTQKLLKTSIQCLVQDPVVRTTTKLQTTQTATCKSWARKSDIPILQPLVGVRFLLFHLQKKRF